MPVHVAARTHMSNFRRGPLPYCEKAPIVCLYTREFWPSSREMKAVETFKKYVQLRMVGVVLSGLLWSRAGTLSALSGCLELGGGPEVKFSERKPLKAISWHTSQG